MCAAEWELRYEWATTELRRQREFHLEARAYSKFQEAKPWNSVLLNAFDSFEGVQ